MTIRRFSHLLNVAVGISLLAASAGATQLQRLPQATALARAGASGPSEATLYSFRAGSSGESPQAPLIADSSGALYGTTSATHCKYGKKGVYFCYGGNVFKLTPSASGYTETPLYVFCSLSHCRDGKSPVAGLVADKSGALYGTTLYGGAHKMGTVFKLTPTASGYTHSIIYDFCAQSQCADGGYPFASLIMDAGGAFYGTTDTGGVHDFGTVFKLTPQGSGYVESVLYSFCAKAQCEDGYEPLSGVTADPGGALYGVTYRGGSYFNCGQIGGGCGTLFKLTPAHGAYTERVLWNFGNGLDGSVPSSGLVAAPNGVLYGATVSGGAYDLGTVFSFNPGRPHPEHVLWSFGNGTDASAPLGVILGPRGTLTGTSSGGGGYAEGTVFSLTPTARGFSEKILYSFCPTAKCHDGSNPAAPPMADGKGNFFGTTRAGGKQGFGAVFEVTP